MVRARGDRHGTAEGAPPAGASRHHRAGGIALSLAGRPGPRGEGPAHRDDLAVAGGMVLRPVRALRRGALGQPEHHGLRRGRERQVLVGEVPPRPPDRPARSGRDRPTGLHRRSEERIPRPRRGAWYAGRTAPAGGRRAGQPARADARLGRDDRGDPLAPHPSRRRALVLDVRKGPRPRSRRDRRLGDGGTHLLGPFR